MDLCNDGFSQTAAKCIFNTCNHSWPFIFHFVSTYNFETLFYFISLWYVNIKKMKTLL